jgi:hypothetical protein
VESEGNFVVKKYKDCELIDFLYYQSMMDNKQYYITDGCSYDITFMLHNDIE